MVHWLKFPNTKTTTTATSVLHGSRTNPHTVGIPRLRRGSVVTNPLVAILPQYIWSNGEPQGVRALARAHGGDGEHDDDELFEMFTNEDWEGGPYCWVVSILTRGDQNIETCV